MQYRKDKYDNNISVLGYGCMRFSQTAGRININKAEKEIMEAVNAGVNYFDTAYIYPGSEAALGEIVERNGIRNDIMIATKLPHYLVKKYDQFDEFLNKQLKRLRTDYVDFYLMHMLSDTESWEKLKKLGIEKWISDKKESGKIRQIGFSYHGNADTFCELLDAYDWDFCQIQYNYLDEHSQAGRKGYDYAVSKGIPVIIMEPLRGGRLVKGLPKKALRLFDVAGVGRTPAGWAFAWLWDQPGVTCVLSGMNSMEMVRENIRNAEKSYPDMLSKADRQLLKEVVEAINEKMKVGCTGCRYCMPCPRGVDIPGAFAAYNRRYTDGYYSGIKDYVMCTAMRTNVTSAANCIECGKCEQHCPQNIEIRKELKNVRKTLHGPVYSACCTFFRLFRYGKKTKEK